MPTRPIVATLALCLALVVATADPAFSKPGDLPVSFECEDTKCLGTLAFGDSEEPVGGSGPRASTSCYYQGKEIDCVYNDMIWSASHGCYYWFYLITYETSPAEVAARLGRPDERLVACFAYANHRPIRRGAGGMWWIPLPGRVSREQLARQAIEQMELRAPLIGMTGGDPPHGMQIVGLPAWLWVADPGDSTTGPITRVAEDRGVSVEATC